MKAFLMFPDRDFDPQATLPVNADDLVQDLELDTLIGAMAQGDAFIAGISKTAVLCSLTEPEDIRYRQDVLRDGLGQQQVIRQIYDLAVEAITRQKKVFGWMADRYPAAILHHSIEVMGIFVDVLHALKAVADEHHPDFQSDGFTRFFRMLMDELDDDYFNTINEHLRRVQFRSGVLLSARLDQDGHGADLILRRPSRTKQSFGEKMSAFTHPAPSFRIADRDEAGANVLGELRGQGINLVADALARSADHILSFFGMLRDELGFYLGCINAQEALASKSQTTVFPHPAPADTAEFTCRSLYDVSLALISAAPVVGNDVSADRRQLIVITGANQGGKSTFLRSAGLAQLMMQCGMFVGAEELHANVSDGVFTHFKREEDASMTRGKLDEELSRMSDIVDAVVPGSLVLFNESFASTNEREGSEIGRRVIRALLDSRIKVIIVTHLYDLARSFVGDSTDRSRFLRADRNRTFKLVEGEPLPTSFGGDLYRKIFHSDPVPVAVDAADTSRR